MGLGRGVDLLVQWHPPPPPYFVTWCDYASHTPLKLALVQHWMMLEYALLLEAFVRSCTLSHDPRGGIILNDWECLWGVK